MNMAWLKAHKYYVLGGLVGILVIVYLIRKSAAPSVASPTPDLSGGASAVTNYDAAASLQNAQVNGQVEVAQVQAGVASQQIAAQVSMNRDTTAAELAAALAKTSSETAIGLGAESAAVQSQRIVTEGQVQQTEIVGHTIDTLGAQHEAVQLQQLQIVGAQVTQIQDHSKHASQDYTAIAPILAIETGQPTAAAATAAANAASRTAASATETAAISGGTSIVQGLLKGLFA